MKYYEILKRRRLDLQLSIQDVSVQTRLAPEYIKAIEENDLDVFSDDLSFVRYFIRAYCQALGVNWNAIQDEVEGSIKYYAHMRNMALTQAQKRMAAQMPAATNESRIRRQPKSYQPHVSQASRSLSKKPRRHLSSRAVALFAIIIAAGLGIWFIGGQLSASQAAAADKAAEKEAQDKEAETKRLAELRRQQQGETGTEEQTEEEKKATVEAGDNLATITVTDFTEPAALVFSAHSDTPNTFWLTQDGEVLSDVAQTTTDFAQTVAVSGPAQLFFQPSDPAGVTLSINGTDIPLSGDGLVTINIVQSGGSDEPAQ